MNAGEAINIVSSNENREKMFFGKYLPNPARYGIIGARKVNCTASDRCSTTDRTAQVPKTPYTVA